MFNCRAQKELVEKEKREEEEAKKKKLTHADEVRRQIRDKEQVRILERNSFFEEGVKLDEEARERRHKLEEVKKKKLSELRYIFLSSSYFSLNNVSVKLSLKKKISYNFEDMDKENTKNLFLCITEMQAFQRNI